MAYTLAQLAKLEKKSYLKKGIIMNMLRDSKFLEWLPWQGVDSLQSYGLRVRTLGTSGAFRKINGSYTEATDGDVEEVWESVYGFGGEVKFDRVYDKIKNVIIDPKQQQLEMKLKAMTLTFNDYVINGDHATDADGFEGLKKRIAGMPSRQTVALGDSAAYDPTAAAANGQYFLTKWEEAWYKCNKGQVNAIIARTIDAEFCSFFRMEHFFSYLDYSAETSQLPYDQLKRMIDRRAGENIEKGTLSATGRKFRDLVKR